jgi:hypothetical protein
MSIAFTIFLKKLLFISLQRSGCIRRFCGCDKGMRKHSSNRKNVVEENPTKGKARLGFSGTQAPKGRSVYNPVRRSKNCYEAPP